MINFGIFTTIKVKQGIPLFFDKHLARLLSHMKYLHWNTFSFFLEEKVTKFLLENHAQDCACKIIVTNENGKSSVTLQIRPLPPEVAEIKLITVQDTRDRYKILKTTNRLVNEEAKQYAEKKGANDALFIQNDAIIESTICNVFSLNEKSELITPALEKKGLKGIARQVIMENAHVLQSDIPQQTNGPLVLVNSLRVQKVSHLNGRALQDGEKLYQKIKSTLEKAENL